MPDGTRILLTREEIAARVQALGGEIERDYAGREPVLISVLKGGTVFLADLFRAIDLRTRVDFMSISRYEERPESTGVVRILKDLDHDIADRDVIVVEDIIDTGLTLSYLMGALRQRGPATLEVCTLLDKAVRRIVPLDIRYLGFDCPDVFAVGYGLDASERFRNLPYIVAVERSAVETAGDLLLPLLSP
ncbi:MAG TPA: hypoxanthine phosphoribosyltransferase [Actinomycetota bacterium]|nr:hypoxanthine phosphoribosyltransferase [Actinomycetota bacterium]